MKKLADLEQGARFLYGGVEWVVLDNDFVQGAALAVAAEPVMRRPFDDDDRGDWRKASLRRELNGPFFDALIMKGANRAAFLDWESDLTADNGATDYGTATDKIALLSDGLYRKYRQLIAAPEIWCWTLTPLTCNPENNNFVRNFYEYKMDVHSAHAGDGGVCPLCYLESSIMVKTPGEDDPERRAQERERTVQEAAEAVLQTLGEYSAAHWVEALTRAMYSVFVARRDAEDIRQEEADKQALDNLAPGAIINLTVNLTETIDAAGKESE